MIDKEQHTVYGILTEQDKQAIREMLRTELAQVLNLIIDKPEVSQVVYQTDTKEKVHIEIELGGKTYCGLIYRQED